MCETFLVEPTPVNCHVIFWKAAYSGRKGVDRVFQLFHVLIPIPSYNFSFIMRNKNHLKFYLKMTETQNTYFSLDYKSIKVWHITFTLRCRSGILNASFCMLKKTEQSQYRLWDDFFFIPTWLLFWLPITWLVIGEK